MSRTFTASHATRVATPMQQSVRSGVAANRTLERFDPSCSKPLGLGGRPHRATRSQARCCAQQPAAPLARTQTQAHSQLQPQPHRQLPMVGAGASRCRRRDMLLGLGGLVGCCWWGTDLEPGAMRAWAVEGITSVFVAGSTGKTGRRVVQQLRKAGFSVRAGVRSTDKALALGFGANPGITIVEADVTKGVDVLVAALGDAQAVVCATGAAGFGANGAAQVDEQGTISLVDAALRTGLRKFVLVSSLLTNAAAMGQAANPNYLFLNTFGGVLIHKLKAENYLRASGLNYTIIRPGGLSNEPESAVGNLIVAPEDSLFALDSDPGRTISRDTVAAVAVQAVLQPEPSRNVVVEVVASPTVPRVEPELWFGAV